MVTVTGATGMLGHSLVKALCEQGETVRILVRSTSDLGPLAGLKLETMIGNILDYSSLAKACRGASVVYHCAALISLLPGTWNKMQRVNVEGTANVLKACREGGVTRLVYISSIEALSGKDRRCITDETEFNPEGSLLDYGKTKALASKLVLEEAAKGLDAVIVCPTSVIGPGDYKPSRMGKVCIQYAKGLLPASFGGGFYFVDIRDVINGILLATKKGKSGANYILDGERASIRQLLELLHQATGKKPPRFSAPYWLAWVGGFFFEIFHTIFGGSPLLTRSSIRVTRYDPLIETSRAAKDLGYTNRPLAETVNNTISWFREQGKI